MALNLWFEHQIDAYLTACAQMRDWREAIATADAEIKDGPRRVLTQRDLRDRKGIYFSRQRLNTKVKDGSFPSPFQLPSVPAPKRQRIGKRAARLAVHGGAAP